MKKKNTRIAIPEDTYSMQKAAKKIIIRSKTVGSLFFRGEAPVGKSSEKPRFFWVIV